MGTPPVLYRRLGAQMVGQAQVLDVIAPPKSAVCDVYFSNKTPLETALSALDGPSAAKARILGAPVLSVAQDQLPLDLNPSLAEPHIFAGRKLSIATHNGEPAQTIVDWLSYHFDHFGMTGAIFIERAKPGESTPIWTQVGYILSELGKDIQILVLDAAIPLGHAELAPEHHAINAPEAPGKDRMDPPAPDPWHAPFLEVSLYEILKARFLGQAIAVANLEVMDLLEIRPDVASPFDLALQSPGQAIQLRGQPCYPWRVRPDSDPGFGDHICVQFDQFQIRNRWCVALASMPEDAILKFQRISNMPGPKTEAEIAPFYRHMAIRHTDPDRSIVPQSSLVEDPGLLETAVNIFKAKPIRAPKKDLDPSALRTGSDAANTTIVTCMKNEGPFLLEWIAYHHAIGVKDILVYTNDCTDGTDHFLDLLQTKGIIQHRQNPYLKLNMKPQHAALRVAYKEPVVQDADWLISMDVDEFINIHVGDGTLPELYDAVAGANFISCTWRLFGNGDHHGFKDDFTLSQFTHCADERTPKPHQAWGFKTLYRNVGIFKKMGVHRPKGLRPQLWEHINWVNGSGKPMPRTEFRNAWRSTARTYGYDLVTMNHYAVRNAESFLVKRDRGRVNHVDRDQGLAYWFRMNNNATQDTSIQRHIPKMKAVFDQFMADPEIAAQHAACVDAHKAKIAALRADPEQGPFFASLTGARMERMARLHRVFGSAVFHYGPDVVPDDIVFADHPDDSYFTVTYTPDDPSA